MGLHRWDARGQMKVRPRAYTSTHGLTAPSEAGAPPVEKSSPFPMLVTDPVAVRYQSNIGTGGSGGVAAWTGGVSTDAIDLSSSPRCRMPRAPCPPKALGATSFKCSGGGALKGGGSGQGPGGGALVVLGTESWFSGGS